MALSHHSPGRARRAGSATTWRRELVRQLESEPFEQEHDGVAVPDGVDHIKDEGEENRPPSVRDLTGLDPIVVVRRLDRLGLNCMNQMRRGELLLPVELLLHGLERAPPRMQRGSRIGAVLGGERIAPVLVRGVRVFKTGVKDRVEIAQHRNVGAVGIGRDNTHVVRGRFFLIEGVSE